MFLPLNYVILVFATHILKLFAICKESCGKPVGRKPVAWERAYERFIFRTLLATIYENFCSGPPLEKILGAPLPWGHTLALGAGRFYLAYLAELPSDCKDRGDSCILLRLQC